MTKKENVDVVEKTNPSEVVNEDVNTVEATDNVKAPEVSNEPEAKNEPEVNNTNEAPELPAETATPKKNKEEEKDDQTQKGKTEDGAISISKANMEGMSAEGIFKMNYERVMEFVNNKKTFEKFLKNTKVFKLKYLALSGTIRFVVDEQNVVLGLENPYYETEDKDLAKSLISSGRFEILE